MLQNNGVKGFLGGFLAGGTIGALAALLTTPKSGKALRGDIKQKSGEYLDEAEKYYTETKHKAGELINEVKSKFTTGMDDAESKPGEIFNDAKSKAKDVLQSGKQKIESEAERLKSSIEAGINTNKKEVRNY